MQLNFTRLSLLLAVIGILKGVEAKKHSHSGHRGEGRNVQFNLTTSDDKMWVLFNASKVDFNIQYEMNDSTLKNVSFSPSELEVHGTETNTVIVVSVLWTKAAETANWTLTFTKQKDNTVTLSGSTLNYPIDEAFGFDQAAKDYGKKGLVSWTSLYGETWPQDKSFLCRTVLKSDGSIAGHKNVKGTLTMEQVQMQAFTVTEGIFSDPSECKADEGATTTMEPTTTTEHPTPAPVVHFAYPPNEATHCLILNASISLTVYYETKSGYWNNGTLVVPHEAEVLDGSCSEGNGTMEQMTIGWTYGRNKKKMQLTMMLSTDKMFTGKNGNFYTCYELKLRGELDTDTFPNAKNSTIRYGNKVNMTTGHGALPGFLLGMINHTLTCSNFYAVVKEGGSGKEGKEGGREGKEGGREGKEGKDNSTELFEVEMRGVRFDAFTNSADFNGSEMQCQADTKTSDLIPIIVGACLAALVVIVLIAYLIGRARSRSAGYESV